MQGLILGLKVGPRNTDIQSYTVPLTVPLNTLRVVNFVAEFQGIARSVAFVNRDAANTCLIIINNDRINTFTLNPSSSFDFNDQWCEQIEVTAGAAGVVNLFMEIVPMVQLGLKGA